MTAQKTRNTLGISKAPTAREHDALQDGIYENADTDDTSFAVLLLTYQQD